MGDRGQELTHGGDAVGVRQLHLHLAEGLFGALTLDELTDLAADGSQHVEQLLIGLLDLADRKTRSRPGVRFRSGHGTTGPGVVRFGPEYVPDVVPDQNFSAHSSPNAKDYTQPSAFPSCSGAKSWA